MWLFLLLLGLLAWFVMRHLAAERQARELAMAQHRAALALEVRQHQRDLSSFEHEQDGVRWEFDFDNMTVWRGPSPFVETAGPGPPCDLKRSDGGAWHYRVPEATSEPPEWIAVPEALAAKVESRYERFLRHYKG